MTNPNAMLRTLITYALCVPAVILLGYWLANWEDPLSFYCLILGMGFALVPMLLRWHHFWLIAFWNTTAMLFFVPGRPSVLLALIFISLVISVAQHGLQRKMPFINVKSVTLPLLALAAVVLVTANIRGGLGLAIAGSANVGGKRYIFLLSAIVGYFALTAQRIPAKKAVLCVATFFASGLTQLFGDLAHFIPPSALYYILLIFPATAWWSGGGGQEEFIGGRVEIGRLGGIAAGSLALLLAMMAIYGVKGVFSLKKFWRAPLFLAGIAGCLLGGYRSMLLVFLMTFGILYLLEGLLTSRHTPLLVCTGMLAAIAILPFADQLPLSMQRSLAVVPYIHLNPFARGDAQGSTEWRIHMWQIVWPQVPKYLLLGKGLSITAEDLAAVTSGTSGSDPEGSMLAGDYHNGPLSLLIPFGAAGTLAFFWLMFAGMRMLYHNYRYGDETLRRLNRFLLAAFIAKVIFFIAVFGSFFGDLLQFTGMLGLSVALNGGMRLPVTAPVTEKAEEESGQLQLAPMNARFHRN